MSNHNPADAASRGPHHDNFYRYSLTMRNVLYDMVGLAVSDQEWAALDMSSCRSEPTEHFDPLLRDRRPDFVMSAKIKDTRLRLRLLFEHKSRQRSGALK